MVNLIPNEPSGRCRIDGFAMQCAMVMRLKWIGSAIDAPVEEVTIMRFRNRVTGEIRYALGIYGGLPDGGAGYAPAGSHFEDGNDYFLPDFGISFLGPVTASGRAVNIADTERYDSFGHASAKPPGL